MKIIATLRHKANPQAEVIVFDFRPEFQDGEARSPMGIMASRHHHLLFGATFALPLGGLVDTNVYPFKVVGGEEISEAALVKNLVVSGYYDTFVEKPDGGRELFSILDELTLV